LFLIFLLTLLYWFFSFNKLHSVALNVSLAKSKNIRSDLTEASFCIMIALIVMLSIKWVGILIINALLTLPAAASRNIASNMREYHLFSVLISIFSGITGLILSFYLGTATGPTVVIISAILFFMTMFFNSVKNR